MIKVLPGHISNLIAAGEVVQRPASVVKELMENAIDAEAKNIQVIVRDAGRTLIQIIDDGSGMSPEDAKTAFLRHATSKISEIEDLSSIHTFGFRGEALASVCSVAEVTLRTKKAEDETGFEVKYAESKLLSEMATATPAGSNFIVRNLFYNVPARRKFLKSDSTEFRQITSEFSRIAITSPSISFRLTHNDKEIFYLPPANLKKRIQDIAGKEIVKELVEISVDTSIIKISGYIGKPEESRKTPGNQYFFVNNRYFRSSYFQKAVLKGYEGLIPEGNFPSFFIFLEADSHNIDVNIHPSKTEIKFQDDYAIFDILQSATRESLGKNSFMPSIDFDMEGAPEIPKIKTGYYTPPPKISYDPLFNPFNTKEIDQQFHTPIFSDSALEQKPILSVSGKYLVTTIKSGIVLIDIRRARERILYEKYLNTLTHGSNLIQQSLFPVSFFMDKETIFVLDQNQESLRYMGFDITISNDSITINGLPEGFNHNSESLPELIDSLTKELFEEGTSFADKSKERMAAQLAKTGSAGKSEPLNNLEAQSLIDTLFACNEPNYTPAGKKCLTILNIQDIENLL